MNQDRNILCVYETEHFKHKIQLFLSNHSNLSLTFTSEEIEAKEVIENYDLVLHEFTFSDEQSIEQCTAFIKEVTLEIPLIAILPFHLSESNLLIVRRVATDDIYLNSLTAPLLYKTIHYTLEHYKFLSIERAKHRQLESLFHRSLDPIFIFNDNFDIIKTNLAMVKLLGFSPVKLQTLRLEKLFDKKKELERFREQLHNGSVREFETVLCAKNKKPINVLVNVIPLDEEIKGDYQCIVHDISQIKRAKYLEMRHQKLMVAANLARKIAHEVRNPLNNINLAIEQLNTEVGENDDVGLYLDLIKRNSGRINQLITDILSSSSEPDLSKVKVPINEILDISLQNATDRINLVGVELVKKYDEDECDILVDKKQMILAMTNLIINAIEAMEGIETPKLMINSKTSKEGFCEIEIKDNGKGIEKSKIENLFDPFYSDKKSGVGFGLTATQNIITGHKGEIDVESKVGKGTSFLIKLPLG
ncbi:ATP-binding protein [Flammeovirgaceae bacterium SG7u.111]|nr:ATP-binding protein [Flammeovirgaceae bacterium SG7u.132]WPO34360.1 ATP-binding protein [Flammeovirgaceae bacterium SG7u.111]